MSAELKTAFLKLTSFDSGSPVYVRPERVIAICPHNHSGGCFVISGAAGKCSSYVRESSEDVYQMVKKFRVVVDSEEVA